MRGRGGAWRGIAVAVLAGACGPLAGALPGIPEAPGPLPAPRVWVDTGNDNLSDSALDRDDYRTGTVDVGVDADHVVAAANASVLTSRTEHLRDDQLTASAGWEWRWGRAAALAVVGGVRTWGDLGGDRVQNDLHAHAGYRPLGFAYDGTHRTDGLIGATGRWLWLTDTPDGWSWLAPPGRWGIGLDAAGLATTNADVEGEVEGDLVYQGQQGSAWAGARWHSEAGRVPGSVAQLVAWRERGGWLMAGSEIAPGGDLGAFAQVGLDPRTHGAFGNVGVLILPGANAPARQEAVVEQDIGYFAGAVVGAQYRWEPLRLDEAVAWPSWLRVDIALDYRFGGVRGIEWYQDEDLSDQLTLGPSLTFVPPAVAGLLQLMPYATLLDGLRVEHILPEEADARFPEAEAVSGVTMASAGIRLGIPRTCRWRPLRGWWRLRLGAGYDRWFPWGSASVANAHERQAYLRTDGGWGGFAGCMLDW